MGTYITVFRFKNHFDFYVKQFYGDFNRNNNNLSKLYYTLSYYSELYITKRNKII